MTGSRRPLRSRNSAAMKRLAATLALHGLRPNVISAAGMFAAFLGGAALWQAGSAIGSSRSLMLLAAALACQLRLLANLLDGMVAVEGGLAQLDGAFWNEAPDRLSDIALFAGAGLAAGLPALGWAVAALAVLTAYLRELGRAERLGVDFCGPMAKQQRMALLTAGCLAAALLPWPGPILSATLWLLLIGTAATALRRSLRLIQALRLR
jgi:phosphatidylglycerophosphate synthase